MNPVVALSSCLLVVTASGAKSQSAPEMGTESAAMVFSRASSAVVLVRVESARGKTQGSGVIIGRGKVVTNLHVVAGAQKVIVTIKGKDVAATVSSTSKADRDLAILDVDTTGGSVATLRSSSTLTVGERVFAIGNPRGYEQTLTDGLVSALRKEGDAFVIQTSAAISPGSSGGGLFDARGKLVGITTLTRTDAQNLNFANPTEWVEALLKGNGVADGGASAAIWSANSRPEALFCELTDSARWGMFSEGFELLESAPVMGPVVLRSLNSTQPEFKERGTEQQLVLRDLSRKQQVAVFKADDNALVFVTFEESGDMRVTLGKVVGERGEPRFLTRTGLCSASSNPEADKSLRARWEQLASTGGKSSGCEEDVPNACYTDALRVDGGQRFVLLKKACRLGHAQGCLSAIEMAESVGDAENARALRTQLAKARVDPSARPAASASTTAAAAPTPPIGRKPLQPK